MAIHDPLRSPRVATVLTRLTFALTLVALTSCGGGGGSNDGASSATGSGGTGNVGSSSSSSSSGVSATQPAILASVVTFPTGKVPAGFLPAGMNSAAAVQITDQTGTPITTASVSIDGVSLAYVAGDQEYEGSLNINPGDTVTVEASVNSVDYTASRPNFSTYPTIIAPAAGSNWSSQAANLISWSGAAPDATALYSVGVMTSSGTVVWPSSGVFQTVSPPTSSTTISANSLAYGNYLVVVGIADGVIIPGAASGSALVIGGFNFAAVTVSPPPAPVAQSLVTSPTTATIGLNKLYQLSAKASYSDGTERDVTASANWSSSDPTKAIVDATGGVTGIAGGTVRIMAQYEGLSASTTVTVFQPNPSPVPPLSESVAYQIDYGHSGRATVGGTGPTFPPTNHWSVTLNGTTISYPVIAAGKVFVTTDGAPPGAQTGSTLYALDETTGKTVWGPITVSGQNGYVGITYDHGTLFVVSYGGLLSTFDAATGTPGWSLQLPELNSVTAVPTAANGIVYVNSTDGLTAIYELNGTVLSVWGGDTGGSASPAISPTGVFISGQCDALELDAVSTVVLWHFDLGCSGGIGWTDAYANNSVYVRGLDNPSVSDVGIVLNAATGTQLGTFNSTAAIPAFSATAGFFLNGSTLTATDLSTGGTLWTFSGDGTLVSAPIVIDNAVVIGSSSGTVYALDSSSGNVLWSGSAGAAISGPHEQSGPVLTGFGAGDGYLVVPAGNVLNGWRIIP
jgi:outer membrane protein assembly factor BamB